MAMFLKVLGVMALAVGVLTSSLFLVAVLAAARRTAAEDPEAAGILVSMAALSIPFVLLYCGGPLLLGTVFYVGGRALAYMDYSEGSARRTSMYQDKERTQERVDRNRAKSSSSGPLD